VRLALTAKVAVLTGGPGCGKSFAVRSVAELARARGARIVLAAPAGRAAGRLAGLTGREAAAIRRLLALRPGGEPSFDAGNPLDADLARQSGIVVSAHRINAGQLPALAGLGDFAQRRERARARGERHQRGGRPEPEAA